MNLIEYRRMYEAEDRHWWYVGLHKLILATVQRESQRLGRPLKIFDAGCGTGRLCQLLASHGHAVSGCDFSEEALRLCSLRGVNDVFRADLNCLTLEPEMYDVITSIDVLSQKGIKDDVAVMQNLMNSLVVGGMLILNLVAFEFLRSTHDIAVHIRERYTRGMLKQRLCKAGFETEFSSYRVSPLFPFIMTYRLLLRCTLRKGANPTELASDVSIPHPFINIFLLKIIEMENALIRKFSIPFGSSLFFVARKNKKMLHNNNLSEFT